MSSKSRLLDHRTVCEYTGKALVGALTQREQLRLAAHVTELEHILDEYVDPEDFFGPQGWRHKFGVGE